MFVVFNIIIYVERAATVSLGMSKDAGASKDASVSKDRKIESAVYIHSEDMLALIVSMYLYACLCICVFYLAVGAMIGAVTLAVLVYEEDITMLPEIIVFALLVMLFWAPLLHYAKL